MTREATQPSPLHFFETVNAYQRTSALRAAVELDLFTALAEGADTAESLARRCNAEERGVRILSDYLVINGFLTKQGNRYGLTLDSSVFLNRHSPAYAGGAIDFLLSPTLTEGFKDLTAAVRKGGTVISEEGTLAPSHPVWVQFARSMAPLAAVSGQMLAELLSREVGQARRVLDIAAGHGMYGISLARLNPDAAIVAQDWPNVLEVAKENARNAAIEGRYSTIEGSAFEVDFGSGYDIVLLTNFLHHFDAATCETLLRKVHASLADGGKVVTLEFVPNEDRVSPPVPAAFSLIMLASTPGGDAYTLAQYQSIFASAGYKRTELYSLLEGFQQVLISDK